MYFVSSASVFPSMFWFPAAVLIRACYLF